MKIAFVVGKFPSLTEIFILDQITGLMSLGHEVGIFSMLRSDDRKIHRTVKDLRLQEKVIYFPKIPKNIFLRFLKAIFLVATNFFKAPVTVLKSINIFSFDKDILSLKVLYYSLPLLKKDFDVIHFHFGNIGIIGTYLRKSGITGKQITTFYGYDLTQFVKQHGQGVYSGLFENSDLLLPICNFFRKKLIAMSCDPEKIKVHHIGIDLEKYRFKKRNSEKNNIPKILSVGRLCEKKGFFYGIKAVKEVVSSGGELLYTIVGDGPLRNKLTELVTQLKLERYVDFPGAVDQDELIEYYSGADIFLLPSITDRNGDQEGTPTVILEAQAVGLPVISSLHSGIPEIVEDSISGFLVEEKDYIGIAEKIDFFINHPEETDRMGERGREFVEKNFDIKKKCLKLEENYLLLYAEKKVL